MFPNNYNIPFYTSYGNPGIGMRAGMGMRTGMGMANAARAGGLFSRLGGGIRAFNWAGLLNNASRTLGVINQAIPLVKQVGPIYNNMKSMLRVASLFKDETDPNPKKDNTVKSDSNTQKKKDNITNNEENTITNTNYSNSPNFFI